MEKSVDMLWTGLARMAAFTQWIVIALFHVAVLQILICVSWAFQISPKEVYGFFQETPYSSFLQNLFSLFGIGLLSALTVYVWALRKIHKGVLSNWIRKYLFGF